VHSCMSVTCDKREADGTHMVRHRLVITLAGFLLLAALAAACGSSNDEAATVRPLDEILDGSIEITDLTATSAVVRVETSLDVVCSVVYGVDESFGSQSTDLDMGGQAHSSHSAPLRDLQPDTEYHYRLQGTGSDGTFYVSDVMAFRTPPGSAASKTPGTNLASLKEGARVVEASSSFGGSATWQPENAIDGEPATEWSSDGDGDDAFITIELAEASELSAVGVWTRTMGSSAQIMSFQVVTGDGTVLGPFELPGSAQMHTFPVLVTARQLRFEVVESSGGNTGAVEVGAYGVR
jgi:hypothetical protein